MKFETEGATLVREPLNSAAPPQDSSEEALRIVLESLEDSKAEDIVAIDVTGKTPLADHMVVASGRSHRHVGAVADRVLRDLKDAGYGSPRVEGTTHCDWVLIDTGDIIVHLFRPEVREFYNLEKMWSADQSASIQVVG
ncbi:ribosome silencing factor [Amorphus orientalis]|uniref:Ribosomal silencing factor RsfS n=1 Tax=Amorphus orientalis TaxID=649198 RepID=A0AAE3VMF1_9HYPH|nr:ribosome silencing factor [Amorphus orientalis]MDQ0314628.1 ribosome-associated protein [Amorphus orientalis]